MAYGIGGRVLTDRGNWSVRGGCQNDPRNNGLGLKIVKNSHLT